MTGLSNHALSAAPRSPLLALFEARPMDIVERSGLRTKTRWAGSTSPFRDVRVILTMVWSAQAVREFGEPRLRFVCGLTLIVHFKVRKTSRSPADYWSCCSVW